MTTEVELLFTCLLGIIFLFYDGLERLFPLKVCMKQTKKQKRHLLLLFSHSVMSDSLQPHGLHTARQAFLSTISSSLLKLMSIESLMPSNHLILCRSLLLLPSIFSSISFFPMSQLFASGGQNIGASATVSVVPMNIQVWFPLGLNGWISLQSKGLARVSSNTTVQKHQFFGSQLSLQSSSHIHTWLLEKT